jgi:hypothetical protein
MSQSPGPRLNLPEPLSGVPEAAVVELGHGRPWLTLRETNRLIRQQGLAQSMARAWVLDELVRAIPLEQEQEQGLIRAWVEAKGVHDETALDAWLERQHLRRGDLRVLATQAERLRRFQRHRWKEEVEQQFLRRKAELDQAVYSLLRVGDRALAEELHHRLQAGEADFAALAARHAEGKERLSRGVVGPLPIAAAHPEIAGRLRVGRAGQLWPPFRVANVWVLLRLEEQLPARLNSETRSRMMGELLEAWISERVNLVLAGQPLPPLPPMPSATEELSDP